MNNFLTRVITALFFGIVCIAGISYNAYTLIALFGLIVGLSLNEFYRLIFNEEQNQKDKLPLLTGVLLFLNIVCIQADLLPLKYIAIPAFLLVLMGIRELYRKEEKPFDILSKKILGILYCSIPLALFCSLAFMADGTFNYSIPLGVIFLLWANDSGAYLIGVSFGKNRLFERISPKKSWEGFFGGLILSLVCAYILSVYFSVLSVGHWLILSVWVVVFGTYGDLIESMFKRSVSVKDSGNLLPGHGGIMDRFDGLLLAAPVVYFYLLLFL